MVHYKRLIDISQPVRSDSAVYPGDTPFRRDMVLSRIQGQIVNLTQFTMSPHIGTHVDAPSHIKGDMSCAGDLVGNMPLEPFIGPVLVVDIAPFNNAVTWSCLESSLKNTQELPARILLRTQEKIRYEVFEQEYSYCTVDLIKALGSRGVKLLGLDTPSVDCFGAESLEAHHELDKQGMIWLENLDLSLVKAGEYFLIAFPVRFLELEASPVRAVLLEL